MYKYTSAPLLGGEPLRLCPAQAQQIGLLCAAGVKELTYFFLEQDVIEPGDLLEAEGLGLFILLFAFLGALSLQINYGARGVA